MGFTTFQRCAVSSTVISAAVTDVSATEQQISTRMALNGVAGAVGFIIGPIVGGIINGKFGARAAYACASAVAALQALYIYKVLPETADIDANQNGKHQQQRSSNVGRTSDASSSSSNSSTNGGVDGNGGQKANSTGRGTPALVNPITSAMKLFTGNAKLRWLSLTGAVQCALEPRAWSNVMLLFMRTHVGLSAGTK